LAIANSEYYRRLIAPSMVFVIAECDSEMSVSSQLTERVFNKQLLFEHHFSEWGEEGRLDAVTADNTIFNQSCTHRGRPVQPWPSSIIMTG